MSITGHASYATIVSAATLGLGTALNSLANNTFVTGAAYDNSSGLYLYADLYLILGTQSARTAGAYVAAFIVASVDGSVYPDTQISCLGQAERGTFPLDAAVTARSVSATNVPIPPGLFKIACYNASTQAFASSGNSIQMRPHNLQNT